MTRKCIVKKYTPMKNAWNSMSSCWKSGLLCENYLPNCSTVCIQIYFWGFCRLLKIKKYPQFSFSETKRVKTNVYRVNIMLCNFELKLLEKEANCHNFFFQNFIFFVICICTWSLQQNLRSQTDFPL